MMKLVESSFVSEVNEYERRPVDEAASGDRAGVGVLNGRVNTAGGHARGTRQREILRLIGSGLCGLLAQSKLGEHEGNQKEGYGKKQQEEAPHRRIDITVSGSLDLLIRSNQNCVSMGMTIAIPLNVNGLDGKMQMTQRRIDTVRPLSHSAIQAHESVSACSCQTLSPLIPSGHSE